VPRVLAEYDDIDANTHYTLYICEPLPEHKTGAGHAGDDRAKTIQQQELERDTCTALAYLAYRSASNRCTKALMQDIGAAGGAGAFVGSGISQFKRGKTGIG
jgi:hypothetical protein